MKFAISAGAAVLDEEFTDKKYCWKLLADLFTRRRGSERTGWRYYQHQA